MPGDERVAPSELARREPGSAYSCTESSALPSASVDGLRARGRGARRGQRGGWRRARGGGARGRWWRRRCAPLRAAVRHRRVLRLVVRVGGLLLLLAQRPLAAHPRPRRLRAAAVLARLLLHAGAAELRLVPAVGAASAVAAPAALAAAAAEHAVDLDGHALARRLRAGEHGERGERRPARVLVGHDRRLARRRVRVARRAARLVVLAGRAEHQQQRRSVVVRRGRRLGGGRHGRLVEVGRAYLLLAGQRERCASVAHSSVRLRRRRRLHFESGWSLNGERLKFLRARDSYRRCAGWEERCCRRSRQPAAE